MGMEIIARQTVKLQCVLFILCSLHLRCENRTEFSQATDDLCPIIICHAHPSLLGATLENQITFKNYTDALSLFNKC